MKKKESIVIRDPLLRLIRDNLRTIIKLAVKKEMSRLLAEGEEFLERYFDLKRMLKASILQCPACFKGDKDMTFEPSTREWYCSECYVMMKEAFEQETDPDYFEWKNRFP